jgi:hypothetical protein
MLLECAKFDAHKARRLEADVQSASDTVGRIATLFKLATGGPLAMKPLSVNNAASQ